VLKVKHITQVLQERSGEKKRKPSQKTGKETKEYQPSNEDKGGKKKQLLEGEAVTTKKEKKNFAYFLTAIRSGMDSKCSV